MVAGLGWRVLGGRLVTPSPGQHAGQVVRPPAHIRPGCLPACLWCPAPCLCMSSACSPPGVQGAAATCGSRPTAASCSRLCSGWTSRGSACRLCSTSCRWRSCRRCRRLQHRRCRWGGGGGGALLARWAGQQAGRQAVGHTGAAAGPCSLLPFLCSNVLTCTCAYGASCPCTLPPSPSNGTLQAAGLDSSSSSSSIDVRIKWPNDVYAGQLKLGGILCHSSYRDRKFFVIMGVRGFFPRAWCSLKQSHKGGLKTYRGLRPPVHPLLRATCAAASAGSLEAAGHACWLLPSALHPLSTSVMHSARQAVEGAGSLDSQPGRLHTNPRHSACRWA